MLVTNVTYVFIAYWCNLSWHVSAY